MANQGESVITPVKHEYTRSMLMRMDRADLDEVGVGLNINPRRYSNKGKLADAILLEQNDGLQEAQKITDKQEVFCQLYGTEREFFGNGTQAYIEAFDVDVSNPGSYASARASAAALLTNINILKRIDDIREEALLNDQLVDKKTAFWIIQEANPMASIAAIREYNKVRNRGDTNKAHGAIGAVIQNNTTVNFNDPRGKWLQEKYTEFMAQVTVSENTAEDLKGLRNAKDYA